MPFIPKYFTFIVIALSTLLPSCKKGGEKANSPLTDAERNGQSAMADFSSISALPDLPSQALIDEGATRSPIGRLEAFAVNESQIDWQPLSPGVMKLAQRENKPVLLLCCDPKLISFRTFQILDQDPTFSSLLYSTFIPAVVDVQHASQLSSECDLSVLHSGETNASFPMFIILTPQGIPLMIQGIAEDLLAKSLQPLINQLRGIGNDWNERSNFYSQDALRMLYSRRSKNYDQFFTGNNTPLDQWISKLSYGVISNLENSQIEAITFNRANPALAILSLIDASQDPLLSQGQRLRLKKLAIELGQKSAYSFLYLGQIGAYADGSLTEFFSTPRSVFSIENQCNTLEMLVRLHELSGEDHFIDQAKRLMAWMKKNYAVNDSYSGLLSPSSSPSDRSRDLLFTMSGLKKFLTSEEIVFLSKTCNISESGNLPIGSMMNDSYSKLNSVTLVETPKVLAEELGVSLNEFFDQFHRINAKLQKLKAQKIQIRNTGVADLKSVVTIGMAHLLLFPYQTDVPHLEQAQKLFQHVLQDYRLEDGRFVRILGPDGDYRLPATAHDLAALAHFSINLYWTTGEDPFLDLSKELVTTIKDEYMVGELILELPDRYQLVPLSATQIFTATGDSTVVNFELVKKLIEGSQIDAKPETNFAESVSNAFVERTHYGAETRRYLSQGNRQIFTAEPTTDKEKRLLMKEATSGATIVFIDEKSEPKGDFTDELKTQILNGKRFIKTSENFKAFEKQ